jgi:hypothetical protein
MPRPWNPRQAYEEAQFVLDCASTFLSANFAKILPWRAGTWSSLYSRRTGGGAPCKTSLLLLTQTAKPKKSSYHIRVTTAWTETEFRLPVNKGKNKFMRRRLWKQATALKKEATTLSMEAVFSCWKNTLCKKKISRYIKFAIYALSTKYR